MATTYAALNDLKPRVSNPTAAGTDIILQQMLDSAAVMVDGATRGYRLGCEAFSASSSATRYFDDRIDDNGLLALIDGEIASDCLTVTAITIDGVTVDSADYKLWPYNRANGPATHIRFSVNVAGLVGAAAFYGRPFARVGSGTIAITGTWGYCTAANRPPAIKEATLVQAEKMYEAMGLAPEALAAGIRDPYQGLNKMAAKLLEPFMRFRNGVVRVG